MCNVAVVGLGMGQEHLHVYSAIPGVRILAIADIDEQRLVSCAERFGVARTYTDYRDLIGVPEIDAVSVCLPNYLHAPVALAALAASKHVLVEKPMALSVAEAEAMLATARKHHRILAVAMNYRWIFGPEVVYLKHLIGQGRLGRVYYIRSVSLRTRTFLRGEKTWFTDKVRSGGGALMDMGPHMLDLAMWLVDDFVPVQVAGVTNTALMTDTDVDDQAVGLIRMKSGITIALESTWESFTRPALSVTVLGTRGGAVLDLSAPQDQRLTLYSADDNTVLETRPVDVCLPASPDATVQEHFINSIRSGRHPEVSGDRGLAVLRVLEAIYQGSAAGHDVAIDATEGTETP